MSVYTPPSPWSRGDVWAQTADEARRFDADAIERIGVPGAVLMENAGRGAAALVHAAYPHGPVLGLVGNGNNGGDALVLLRTLAAWGVPVHGVLVSDRSKDDPLAHGWSLTLVRDDELDEAGWKSLLKSCSVVVDGLLGTGARGAPRDRQAAVIERVRESGRPVVSLDLPSGVDGTTGAVPGDALVAERTITFGAPKLGTLLNPGRQHSGRVTVLEIGFPPLGAAHAGARVVTPAWALGRLPRRGTDTHKNKEGRVLVVGGGEGMAGAALLAARAAFRAGAGLVRIAAASANRAPVQSGLPEAMFLPFEDPVALASAVRQSDAVVVGPGLGRSSEAEDALRVVTAESTVGLVLDADALNLVSEGVVSTSEVAERLPLLVTPHPGEMRRLLPDLEGSPVQQIEVAVEELGCTVLLKGAPTVVRAPGGPTWIDTQSSSDLAVAGMGDTLAGVCGALMAIDVPPDEAGALALYLSGRAARIASRGAGLTPSDVIDHLPDARGEEPRSAPSVDLPFLTYESEAAR